MAIRERKGRASPWQVYWNNPFTGKRECANFATKEEALKEDSLIKHRLKFERESFKSDENENDIGESEGITLEQAYLLYLREKQFSKESLKWQLGAMRLALLLYGQQLVTDMQTDHIVAIMNEHSKLSVKAVTIRGRMSVLRTVLRWCSDKGYCAPIRFPKLPPAYYEKFVPPTPDELVRLLEVAFPHIQRVIILGAQCGVRIGPSELLRLTWEDVDLNFRVIRIHGAKKNMTSPWREVPIRESLIPVFFSWKEADLNAGIQHIIHYNGKPVTSIKTAWAHTLKKANITRRIRPYDLRHAFATELIANGADIGTVAKLMGHNSPTMILNHYQHVMDKQKQSAIESLPDLLNVPKPCVQTKKARTELQ